LSAKNVNGSPTEFLVHEEAIAQLSKPLYTLMKGGWQNLKPDVQYNMGRREQVDVREVRLVCMYRRLFNTKDGKME
jgi:hypothetical protein